MFVRHDSIQELPGAPQHATFPTAPSRVACLPEYFMYCNYLKRLGTRQHIYNKPYISLWPIRSQFDMDLARAPRRRPLTARKKGSGYENGLVVGKSTRPSRFTSSAPPPSSSPGPSSGGPHSGPGSNLRSGLSINK